MSAVNQDNQDEARVPATIGAGARGLVLRSLAEYMQFAKTIADSGLAPKGMEKPETIMVAIQLGAELGLPPMSALQNIAVINGRPGVWGDAALALCKASPAWDESRFREEIKYDANGQPLAATCTVARRGGNTVTRTFTVADAKRAGLWGKRTRSGEPTPWVQYPARMLQMRARAWALRDCFPDCLKGISIAEEIVGIAQTSAEPSEAQVVEPAEPAESKTDALARRLQPAASGQDDSEPERAGEQADAASPGPSDEGDHLNEYRKAIQQATGIRQVNELARSIGTDDSLDSDSKEQLLGACRQRVEAIRASRGQRSNRNAQQTLIDDDPLPATAAGF